jgi:hypothetical protein
VDGGTFPAEIWASVIVAIEGILEQNIAEDEEGADASDSEVDTGSTYVAPTGDSGSPSGDDTSGGGAGGGGAGGGGGGGPAPSGGGGGSSGGGSTGGTTGGTGL